MKYFLCSCMALAFVFCASINAFAANNSEIVKKIQNRYEQTNAFEAAFAQTLTHRESGATENRSGRLEFQKPLLARWQTDKPNAETIVINQSEVWDYIPDEGVAYKYDPRVVQDSRNIIQVITGRSALTKDFDVKEAGRENNLAKLELYPHEPSTQLVECQIWVDPDSGYIRRARIVDFYGNSNDVRFEKFAPKASIPSDKFSFRAPKGIDVEDMTKRDIQERELFK